MLGERTEAGRAATRPRIYFNGKFYSGVINGVHRVADRLLRQIDAIAEEGGAAAGWDMRLLLPDRSNWAPPFRHIAPLRQRHGHTQIWEQLMLPFAASDGLLVNLANLSPLLHRNKVTMVHDAQFRISPASYPPKLRWGYRLLIPMGARTSRAVLTVSDYARDSLDSFGFARREHIRVIPNAADHMMEARADPAILDRLALRPKYYCLLFGTVAGYKNIDVVLRALRHPALESVGLVVVGASAKMLAAAGIALPARTRFAGAVDDGALRALYENALCLLFPSRTEGFGLPPLEAMTCGCPVISAPAGAMPEICRDAALYASASDPADWVRQILALKGDPVLRRVKITAGRARARAYRWRTSAERLIDAVAAQL